MLKTYTKGIITLLYTHNEDSKVFKRTMIKKNGKLQRLQLPQALTRGTPILQLAVIAEVLHFNILI